MSEPSGTRLSLERLFHPQSIALVGATDRSIWSVSAFDNLTRAGFKGKIHLVNPKGGVIHGRPAVTSCAAVGEPIDAALLMVPEAGLLDALQDLHAAKVSGAVILSSGFAELGAEGAARQAELSRRATALGIRLIGPNCLGFANFLASTPLWTTPLRRPMANPALAIVSQSGALAGQLEQFAYQQRIALTHMVSTGNEADITVADVIEYLAAQPEPRAIAVFLESVRNPDRFIAAARAAREAGKALVVLKVGTSEAAAKAAQAHTGSLVGNDRVFNSLCKKHGIVRVGSLEELIITADLLGRVGRLPSRGGLALLAMSGGLCEIATDRSDALGLPLAELSSATKIALRQTLPPLATPANPLDITGAAMLQPELITQSIRTIAQDPDVALVAYVFDVPMKEDARGASRNFIKHVAAGFAGAEKPGVLLSHTLVTVTGEGRALVDEYNVVYSGAGANLGLAALSHLFSQRGHRAPVNCPSTTAASNSRPASERAVLHHLASHDVEIIPAVLATSASQAAETAAKFAGPVVLKIASADIAHKTDVGGVMLNVSGADAARAAYQAIMQRVTTAKPDARIDGVIVSPMRKGGVELFVGTLSDPQWGPAIAVGLGGVFVEALKDTSLRLLPIDTDDALEMLNELRGSALLNGFRGAPAVDRAAVARAIVAIGNAALALGPDLVALEVNPLLACADRVEALDGLAIWK